MINQLYKTFFHLVYKKHFYTTKEVIFSIVLFIILIISYLFDQCIGNLIFISYLFFSSLVSFTENEIFWKCEDFVSLKIMPNTKQYFILYVIQRIALDSFLINLVMFIVIGIFLLIMYGTMQFLCFLSIIFAYYCISPYYSVINTKGSKLLNYFFMSWLLVVPALFWIAYLLNEIVPLILRPSETLDLTFIVFLEICIIVLTKTISLKCKTKISNMNILKNLVALLKKININLYKEYLINYKMICINIMTLIFALICIVDYDPYGIANPIILLVISNVTLFSTKDKDSKEYLLVFNDPLFCKNINWNDVLKLRKMKFYTVLSGCIIKAIITIGCICVYSTLNLSQFIITILILVISSLREYYCMHKKTMLINAMTFLINVSIIVIWILNILISYLNWFIYLYVLIILCIYIYLDYSIIHEEVNNKTVIV